MTKIFSKFLLLTVLAVLAGCATSSRQLNVALNGRALLDAWRCEGSLDRVQAEAPQADGQPATIAQKLLQCPFYRDYQIAAMQRNVGSDIGVENLSEIAYKMRWGIDFQYREYEDQILNGPKKRFFIPRIIDRTAPLLGDVLELGEILNSSPMKVGRAGALVTQQMQFDRAATLLVIEARLAAYKDGKQVYPLWQAMIDLDAYYQAGTILSAIESLNRVLTARSMAQPNL